MKKHKHTLFCNKTAKMIAKCKLLFLFFIICKLSKNVRTILPFTTAINTSATNISTTLLSTSNKTNYTSQTLSLTELPTKTTTTATTTANPFQNETSTQLPFNPDMKGKAVVYILLFIFLVALTFFLCTCPCLSFYCCFGYNKGKRKGKVVQWNNTNLTADQQVNQHRPPEYCENVYGSAFEVPEPMPGPSGTNWTANEVDGRNGYIENEVNCCDQQHRHQPPFAASRVLSDKIRLI